ncbi:hypothetical protein [Cellulomonas palmilytica]|uniref:hypothetical protein n=1 Tax=Cellulomonas palmilytica TaxID=2608402 RepID=UPI001F24D15C|nr:hypothetical protein [Cellulomonas palmilytica]UJP39931.1 hypothetical protein F1D97_16915 [Cellulomonas palmilytica]
MTTRTTARHLVAALTAGAVALTLTACGGDPSPDEAATPSAASTGPAPADPPRGPAGDTPGGLRGGVSGAIVQVGDGMLQLRDDDGQTAVTWTDETAVQVTNAADLSAVTVGSCVVATTGGFRLPSDDQEPAVDRSTDETPAATVTVSQPVDGACAVLGGGFPGGGRGQRPDGMPTDLPSDFPTDLPDDFPTGFPGGGAAPGDLPTDLPSGAAGMPGGPGGLGGFGGVTAGLVTAVDATTITVETTAQDGTTSSATVVVDGSTTVTTTTVGDASAFEVGRCATVRGEADDSGKVAATSVAVSTPGDDGCSTGFGGFGGFGGMPGTGGPGGSGAGQGGGDA